MPSSTLLCARATLVMMTCVLYLSAKAQDLKQTPSGFTATANGITMRVTALRDDVLRVRMWQGDAEPEDASWAVLPASRTSTVSVTPEPNGFSTGSLRVREDGALLLTITDLAGHVIQKDAAPVQWDGTSFKVSKQNTWSDHFFALGDKPGPLDRKGETFTMWNTDAFGWQESTDPIYKSIPFFINMKDGRALGVFLDSTWRTNFDFGHTDLNTYTFGAVDGPLDYYVIYGPEPKAVVSTWAWLTGPTPLPPMWALGFQQSRYSYFPESQLMGIAARLRKDRIPADVVWLDIDFQHKNWPFTVNQEAFPNFPGMVKDLARENLKLVVITDLHIARQPHVGYAPYDSGIAGDEFVKNPNGSIYVGPVWPGPAVFPDFTQSRTREWWGTLYKTFVSEGVAGFWNDMNEPAIFDTPSKTMPDDVQHRIDEPGFRKRTATHLEIHNVYGMQNARATNQGLLTLRPNERPFVMSRAEYAGGQRYSTTWTGDNSSTWNHLRMTVPQLVNLGLSGFSLAGADVGGFAGSPPPDLLTKWIEVSAFQPIDRDHSAKGTRMHEVWVDGPAQEAIRRHYIEERYRLMPYLYTVAEETSRDGLPIDRPLFLEFPHAVPDGTPFDLTTGGGEFLVGSRILVAPNPSPEEIAPYVVRLPPGTWYDYWTGEQFVRAVPGSTLDAEQRDKVLAEKQLSVTPRLDVLPVYVRGGTILPIAPLTQSTAETPVGPLTLRVYPSALKNAEDCSGDVYTDDGHTFAFRRGSYARIHFTCSQAADGSLTVNIGKQEGDWKPWWMTYRIEVVGWKPKQQRATVDGHAVPLAVVAARWGVTVTPGAQQIELR
ncbi:MAG TPA: TIM-barrel domain-containing protein [Acidobacteriaceae bacterium]|nr:TIM-barrel domain-containing protein [Acidobacteriaceae bacterium]